MDSNCISVKSKNDFFTRCNRKKVNNSDLCSIHVKQKKCILYDPNKLSPIDSCNDTDIVSLERIYYIENNVKILAREIKPNLLFSYKIDVCGQTFQRTLNILTMKCLIDSNHLKDPFSNVPLPNEVIENAKEMIKILKLKSKKLTKTEQKNILFTNLIRKFEEIGYIIQIDWLINMKKNDLIKWYNEVIYLWNDFRSEYIEIAITMYPALDLPKVAENKDFELNVLKLFSDITISNIMGIMIVLSALSFSNEKVKSHYPDIN